MAGSIRFVVACVGRELVIYARTESEAWKRAMRMARVVSVRKAGRVIDGCLHLPPGERARLVADRTPSA